MKKTLKRCLKTITTTAVFSAGAYLGYKYCEAEQKRNLKKLTELKHMLSNVVEALPDEK